MTLLEEIYEAARQAAPSGTGEAQLQRLCEVAAAQWQRRLKDGVSAEEDCRPAFVCAAAWTAVTMLYTQESAQNWNVESFTVGDVSVKTSGGEKTTKQSIPQTLMSQARDLMRPFCKTDGFSFVGVRG